MQTVTGSLSSLLTPDQSRHSPTPPENPTRTCDAPEYYQEYDADQADAARSALYHAYPSIPEVDFDGLASAVLPFGHHSELFGSVCKQLVEKGVICEPVEDDSRPVFWNTPGVELLRQPKASTVDEGELFFEALSAVFQAIEGACRNTKPDFSPVVSFSVHDTKPLEGASTSQDRYNGSFLLARDLWTDAEKEHLSNRESVLFQVLPVVSKQSNTGSHVEQNLYRLVWAMHRIMRDDPRRRFTFGLTVENTTVRFTYHDRASVVVSTGFDIHEDWRKFVQIVVFFLTATREQLGYDSSVQFAELRKDEKGDLRVPAWDYTAFDESGNERGVFRTVRRLVDIGAEDLTGRGTRVWEVQKVDQDERVDKNAARYVLKDYYVEADREPEYTTLNTIVNRLKMAQDPRSQHFLSVFCAGPVTCEGGAEDKTNSDVSLLTADGRKVYLNKQPKALSRSQEGHVSSAIRCHIRLVFDEVGQTIDMMDNLPLVFHTLAGAACGLSGVFAAGFIHRDVSLGNILLVRRPSSAEQQQCKCSDAHERHAGLVPVLIDFEFALEANSDSPRHKVRTFTQDFAAADVLINDFELQASESDDLDQPAVPFRMNALHDLEPLLWIASWVFVRGAPSIISSVSSLGPFSEENWRKAYDVLFRSAIARGSHWRNGSKLKSALTTALPGFALATNILHMLRFRLFKRAKAVYKEAGPEVKHMVIHDRSQDIAIATVFQAFREAEMRLAKDAEWSRVKLDFYLMKPESCA